MAYHVRRKDREIVNSSELNQIIARNKYATLSLCYNNEPYIVTLTYGYDSYFKSLYFHCSKTGLKLDLHEKHPLAKTEHEKTIIQRQIDSTDRRIDELVYELYGLTKRY